MENVKKCKKMLKTTTENVVKRGMNVSVNLKHIINIQKDIAFSKRYNKGFGEKISEIMVISFCPAGGGWS